MRGDRVIVIGAGIGGLAAALDLSSQGVNVTLLEKADYPGGKLHQLNAGGALIDAGPTVFTMRWVFDELFARAGTSLADHIRTQPVTRLARHGWQDGGQLDLFSDIDRTAEAIAAMSGSRDAAGFRAFSAEARRIYETLETPFILSERPSLPGLIARVAGRTPGNLWCIQPYASLWRKLGRHFRDPRLRQLFARYSTYCGSSPFQCPATLMLIAHVERQGVWLVDGGMQKIADATAALAVSRGCEIRYRAAVEEIGVRDGRARSVRLANGEWIEADAIICNGDVNAVATGEFGQGAARAAAPIPPARRSLSAMTWAMKATASGFPLIRHNVFFCENYGQEFRDIFGKGQMPRAPTIYVCAQDRGDRDAPRELTAERLFCVMNAPANGDGKQFGQKEIERCAASMRETLKACGLRIEAKPEATVVTTPAQFHQRFPATGGALYGRASHGWTASFQRASARSRIPGLYFAGGSAHPGAGLPMAALSGSLAAHSVTADLVLQKKFHPVAMPGGMSTA